LSSEDEIGVVHTLDTHTPDIGSSGYDDNIIKYSWLDAYAPMNFAMLVTHSNIYLHASRTLDAIKLMADVIKHRINNLQSNSRD